MAPITTGDNRFSRINIIIQYETQTYYLNGLDVLYCKANMNGGGHKMNGDESSLVTI